MSIEKKKKKDEEATDILQPDPETLNTSDPQDHMKGPVSSTMHKIKEEAEKNDTVSKEEADQEREKNM